MFKRLLSLASAAVAMAFGGVANVDRSVLRGHRAKTVVRRVRQRFNTSRYTPHQGARECERRRIGGFYTLRQSAK